MQPLHVTLLTALLLAGCGGGGGSSAPQEEAPKLSKEELGDLLFHDTNLSLTRSISCASCHNADHGLADARYLESAHGNPVGGALSLGDDGLTLGGRNAPTAGYAQLSPDFHRQEDGSYKGGQFHDGRAASLKEQAKGPFLDAAEMMMPDSQSVIERVKENDLYVSNFKTLYGETIFDDTEAAYDALAEAIAKYEKTEEFAPFDSKYDRWKAGKAEFSEEEELGYTLFFSNNNTNCATCHALNSQSESPRESFTNFEYENIGTPRNTAALSAKGLSLQTTDLGLGGRADINDSAHYGKFKVPTLRNVAVTAPYMSNGVFKELRTVIAFYDFMAGQGGHVLNPETLQPWDAPEVNATINHAVLQSTKPLTEAKIDALVAFLKTLTDARYEHLLD